MGARRWRWRSRSTRRLRRMHSARGCSAAGGIVHILNRKIIRDRSQIELVAWELLVESGFADCDGQSELIEWAIDHNLGGKVDVTELLVVAIEGLRHHFSVVVVDVLLVRQQVGSADMDDVQGARDVALGLGEE